jgi:serine/threonine protein kinase
MQSCELPYGIIPFEDILIGDAIYTGNFGSLYHGYYTNSTIQLHLVVKESNMKNELDNLCRMMQVPEEERANIITILSFKEDDQSKNYTFVYKYSQFQYRDYENELLNQYGNAEYQRDRYTLYTKFIYYALKAINVTNTYAIVHGDIKLDNFLVDGDDFFPLLDDYGMSTYTVEPFKSIAFTRYYNPLFDVIVESPETLFDQPFNALFDVYSLGFEMYQEINLDYSPSRDDLVNRTKKRQFYLDNKDNIPFPDEYFKQFEGDLVNLKDMIQICMLVPQNRRCKASLILDTYYPDSVKVAFKLK